MDIKNITVDSIAEKFGIDVEDVKAWLNGVVDGAVAKKVTEGDSIPKYRFDEVNEKYKRASEEVKERDAQIESLKGLKTETDALKSKIEEIQSQNKASSEAYEKRIEQMTIDSAVESALLKAKAKTLPAVKALIDMSEVKIKDGKVLGIDKQVEALVSDEKTKYLFESEVSKISGAVPMQSSGPTETDDFIRGFRENK